MLARSLALLGCVCAAAALRVPSSATANSRRDLLRYAAAATATTATPLAAFAAGTKPVLVLGANGGTGSECVNYLLAQNRPCIAATRTGDFIGDSSSKLLTVAR